MNLIEELMEIISPIVKSLLNATRDYYVYEKLESWDRNDEELLILNSTNKMINAFRKYINPIYKINSRPKEVIISSKKLEISILIKKGKMYHDITTKILLVKGSNNQKPYLRYITANNPLQNNVISRIGDAEQSYIKNWIKVLKAKKETKTFHERLYDNNKNLTKDELESLESSYLRAKNKLDRLLQASNGSFINKLMKIYKY